MSINLKYLFSLFLVAILTVADSECQLNQSITGELDLKDSGRSIENVIRLYISGSDYEAIKAITGEKVTAKAQLLIINRDTLVPEEISTRGQSTLSFRRKSYSMKLKSDALFKHGEKVRSLKKFFVLGLSMDKYYSHNRMAFEMLEECILFHLFYTFCELKINDHSEGICLVVERPEDWAIDKKDSPLLIRRGYNHAIDKKESGKKIEKTEADRYIGNFRQIYRSLNKYKGEELLNRLSDLLDIDAYMKWMAFNLLVRNGDYTDEVFFYVDPGSKKFGVIPWDYDDLFSAKPHEAIVDNSNPKRDKLIFSYEDVLDKKIADDPYLYNVYMVQVKEVLNKLSPEVMKRVFENTYSELYPYFSDKEIIGNSRFDLYKDANPETLKDDLISSYHRLIISRNYFLNYLESRIK